MRQRPSANRRRRLSGYNSPRLAPGNPDPFSFVPATWDAAGPDIARPWPPTRATAASSSPPFSYELALSRKRVQVAKDDLARRLGIRERASSHLAR